MFAPNGTGRVGDGGVHVTGRWPWGSGTQHCQWILGGTRCDDDTFRLCFFPATDVTFHDTWHSSGLRGTGSLDFSVEDAFVPDARTLQPGVTRPMIDSPLAAFPNFALLASGIAAVALGIGRRALDELVAMAAGKRPQFSSRSLAQSPFAQIELAKAEAGLRAGRAFLLDELATTWDRAVAGGRVELPNRIAIRLASVNATRAAVAAVDAGLHAGRRVERVLVQRPPALPPRRPRGDAAHHGGAQARRDPRQADDGPGRRHQHALTG